MTLAWQEEVRKSSQNSREVSDARRCMQNGAWQMPIEAGNHLFTHTHPHASWPTREFAEYMWPPSVYEAARSTYPVSHPWQPSNDFTMGEYAIPSEMDVGVWQTMNNVPCHQGPSSSRTLPQSADGFGIRHENLVAAQEQQPMEGSPMANGTRACALIQSTESKRDVTNMSGNRSEPRCPICVGKPPFTGQYAQRNLIRHMERHEREKTAGSDGIRHISCRQPGCTSTFGRDDALLVHLRRSHPELNIPPAKKRKP